MADPVDPPFADASVAAIYAAYPPELRARLLDLRRLIFETADATPGVGALVETLKWGQPSYLTPSGSGSTIRIDQVKRDDARYALFVHCQTDLVATYRALYSDELRFEGTRSIVFERDAPLPRAALGHCIALALTYHSRKRRA
ncbi:DUF1801 domain-containing protein [Phreatobacter aquaticus]|uniref:DUF1801 domain-containing protein n=1 Tax=Phreatobacter aquaticus TaxID=2570229 RepID=A0A4D7QI32_9HYPH|nr:DUF1801 domain-containing protein [Phreatobacter aquaticus]QCK85393.1 DUF1801 domain-containing protein [Phreatobacter aquaticus]